MSRVFEKFTIKNVIYILANVWVKITEKTLKNAWRNLSFGFDKQNVPSIELPRILSFQTFLSGKNMHTCIIFNWLFIQNAVNVNAYKMEIVRNPCADYHIFTV